MDEQVKWLTEHKFNYNETFDEWRRDLNIQGNFAVPSSNGATVFQKRDIQVLKITVKHYEQNGKTGWIAKVFVKNSYDLESADRAENEFAQCRNQKSMVCESVSEAIRMAGRDCLNIIMSCANQVAKICDCTVQCTRNED